MSNNLKMYKSATVILDEVYSKKFLNWTTTEKILNIEFLEISSDICTKLICDGDFPICVRLKLSLHHHTLNEAILLIQNQPEIVSYVYQEVPYPFQETRPVLEVGIPIDYEYYALFAFTGLSILYFIFR